MIVRKIKPEELKRTRELFAIAFETGANNEKSADEVFEEIRTNPRSREDAFWGEKWAAFEDDNKTMMSYFGAVPFNIHFDGNVYKMTGIGGVSSLPQYRKQGGIRRCFETALPVMYKEGVIFSYLYPFSTYFYNKFGYGLGCEKCQYHIKISTIRPFDVSGKTYLAEPEKTMLNEIKQIYRSWQNKYNMMVINEDYEYAWAKASNPVKDQIYTYVYISENEGPMGYMSVKQVNEHDGRNLQCLRFCFTTLEGLKGLLNVIKALGTDHDYVTLELPNDVDLTHVLPEWNMGAVLTKKYYSGMVRVVNVETVLKGARYIGDGKLAIEIKDEQIAENCGVFTIEFIEDKAVSVTKDKEKSPDVCMNINDFSRLICGNCDTGALEYMEKVIIYDKEETLGQVFYKKPNLIVENF